MRTHSVLLAGVAATGLLVVGSAGGAVAGHLVTGQQIKDNTVQSRDIRNHTIRGKDIHAATIGAGDLTGAARRSLKGRAGPVGPKGDTGPKGEKGDPGVAGSPGLSGYQQVTVESAVVGAYDEEGATASCPSGTSVLGGGYFDNSLALQFAISEPDGSSGWEVDAYNNSSLTDVTFQVYAICAHVG